MFVNALPPPPGYSSAPRPAAVFSHLPSELKTAIAIALPNDRDILNLSQVDRHTHGSLQYLLSSIGLDREIRQRASPADFQDMVRDIHTAHPRWRKPLTALLLERLACPGTRMLPKTFARLMQRLKMEPPGRPESAHSQKIFKLMGRAFVQIPKPRRALLTEEFMALLHGRPAAGRPAGDFPNVQENYEAVTAALSGLPPHAQTTWALKMPIPNFPHTPQAEKAGAMVDLMTANGFLHASARQIQMEKMDWPVYALPEADRAYIRQLLQAHHQPAGQ